jgi:hypothetical protein
VKLTYANCFVPEGAHGDVLLTDEVTVSERVPGGTEVRFTDRLIDADAAQRVNVSALRLAFEWFAVGEDDPSVVDGISAADLAGAEVGIALLMPAARAALGVSAALGNEAPESFTTVAPSVGGSRYRATETLQCDVAEAVVRARFGETVPIVRRTSGLGDNSALCEKYTWTRDPEWLTGQPATAHTRDVAAAGLINLAAATRGRRGARTLLVYEYNPTHAFAEQYSRRSGARLRLARVRTPRASLLEIPRGGDRLLMPPHFEEPSDGGPPAALEQFAVRHRDLLRERFRVAGVDLWPVLRPRLLALIDRYRSFAAATAPVWRARLKRYCIEAVVVPFDSLPEVRVLLRVAQASGVPTFLVSDGFKADGFSMDGMTADYVLAWSRSVAEHYYSRRSGAPAEVVGNPKADSQRATKPRTRVGGGVRRVLVGSFTFSPVDLNCRRSDSELFLEAVLDGISRSENARGAEIRLKLHPADKLAHYGSVLARFPGLAIDIISTGDVVDEFNQADVYVTTYSTSLLEAVAREVPVLYYRVNPQRLHAPFSDDAFLAARTADTPASLAALLDDAATFTPLAAQARDAWVERYLGPTDGRSTERIERAVLSRLGNPGRQP